MTSKALSRVAAAAVLAIAAVAALTGFARDPVGSRPAAFRTTDGSAACAALESGAVACGRRGAAHALVLHRDGRSETTTLSVTSTSRTDALLAAESWWHGDTVCRAAAARVRCSAGSGTIAVGNP